jgi:hypothetical protein
VIGIGQHCANIPVFCDHGFATHHQDRMIFAEEIENRARHTGVDTVLPISLANKFLTFLPGAQRPKFTDDS